MTLVAWQAEFETGISSVDFEHKEMVELFNQLSIELDHDPNDDAIGDFLGEVLANTSAHFVLEKKIMRDTGYDEYKLYKAYHEQLLDAIRDIMDDHHAGEFGDVPDLLAGRLKNWFEEHFRAFDARLGYLTEGVAGVHS